jgi:hypothetical protein
VAAVSDPPLDEGWIERELALEYPQLRLVSVAAPVPQRSAAPALRERLALLSDRFHGARALALRREPVPAAYRVFFRHIGLDPDVQRTPVEAAALERLVRGGFESHGVLDDALLVSLVETGVPVWALDDERVEGPLGLRAEPGSSRIVVADAAGPIAALFGDVEPRCRPGRGTQRLRLFTVAAPGVPAIHVEEALFGCFDALTEGG